MPLRGLGEKTVPEMRFYSVNYGGENTKSDFEGMFLGTVFSPRPLKQTLIFCVTNMSYLWTYGRNVEISVHGKKLFPNISSEQFSTHFFMDKTFYECTYS